jgi:hypothetical protein
MKNDAMPVYTPHMSPATKFLPYLHAAEDGAGRAQHEGQQWERGLRLNNISCMNKLYSEYIHIPYTVTGGFIILPRDRISNQ